MFSQYFQRRRSDGHEKRLLKLEREVHQMANTQQQIKDMLDGIAADVAPIQAGIDALQANLAAAIAGSDPALLQASLDEATNLKSKFDALAGSLASAGSPVAAQPAPAPAPAPADTAPAPAPAADAPAPDAPAT